MISRSVAQIATASMRTSTSAFFGTGMVLSVMLSWPGSPSTQAFILSGIGNSLWFVFTPAGAYMVSPDAKLGRSHRSSDGGFCLRIRIAEFGGQCARGGADFIAHQRNVFVGG